MNTIKTIFLAIILSAFFSDCVNAADNVTQIPQPAAPAPIASAPTPAAEVAAPNVPIDQAASLQQKMEVLKKVMQASQAKQMQQPVTQNTTQQVPVTGTQNETQVATSTITSEGQVPNKTSLGSSLSPAPTAATKTGMYDDAFSGMVNQLLPMTPDQISKLREIFNENQRAAVTPVGVPPRPATTQLMVDLSPQSTPPVIRLGAGYITSLVFLDSTGQPWPIDAYSIGDPSAFNIQWDKKGNTLLIQAMSYYKRSNMAVILKGLNTPVMLTFLSGQEAIDYRVDLRVPGLGPNALFVQNGLPDSANPILLDVLNGIPPKGSKSLKVVGGDAQAWLVDNKKLYIRTTLDIISPAWKSFMGSVDGTHAYELQAAPVILALQHGKDKTMILTVEGFE